ncbi:MAG: hypothetical protein IT349_10235 [Candidatus Eisenbacteria bacterium]|nr:hypothetical protein [Candidatus Eisenbacteria bacterium]
MQRIGKQAFVFFSVLLLALGLPMLGIPGISAGPEAQAAGPGNGTGRFDVAPAIHPAINHTAFPNAGGPFIMHATARPSGLRYGGGAATASSDVLLVFNEPIDVATLDTDATANNTDFVVVGGGFTFAGASVDPNYPNVIRLTQTTGAAAGDQIRLATIGCIGGEDGSTSKDLTTITIGSGPVICRVDFDDQGDTVVVNDEITVNFDADVDFGSGDSEDLAFGGTAEFDGADLDNPAAVNDTPTFVLTFEYDDGEPYPNVILPGVSHLILAQSRVRWEDNSAENNGEQRFPVANEGPGLVAAYWDSFTTSLWIVMNDTVDPTSTDDTFFTGFFDEDADNGNWAPDASGDVAIAFPGDITPVLKVTNIDPGAGDAEPNDGIDEISNITCGAPLGCESLLDYQGAEALNEYTVAIHVGPGIIRTSYDDRQTNTRTDDFLYVWLSETSADLTDIDVTDFVSIGFDMDDLSINDRRNENDLTRITFTGFTNTNYPRPGSRLGGSATNNIVGANSGDDLDDSFFVRIWDESRPFGLTMTENATYTYDKWNEGAGIDSIFVAWTEGNGTDGDDYYLFFSKESPTNLTATWMNTYLGSAIALGDPKPQATTGLIRAGFLVDPGVTMTTDGVVLEEGDQIYVLVAAADQTGNLSLRGDLDNSPVSNHVFGAFLVGPLCPPRDYITDCSLPAEADSADWDMDVIHIVGDSTATGVTHYIYGDAGAIPCDADSVVIYDGSDPNADNRLGQGVVGSDGSFTFIELVETDTDVNVVYVFSKSGDSDFSTGTPIIFQRNYPTIFANTATHYADGIFDPWNPYRIYNDNDFINIRFLGARSIETSAVSVSVSDGLGGCDTIDGENTTTARSALLHAWADFTQIDGTSGNITGFGTPADSIGFVSLGADRVDNDGDWENSRDLDDSGTIEDGELFDDVGLDGVAGTNDDGEGDGLKTYGDAYVDENGNGQFDVGETFVDLVHDNARDHVFNPGEPNLDSNDPEEFGWYELAATTAGVRGTVRQGYPMNNPIAEAMLDPFTPIPVWIEDHGIDGNARTAYPAGRDLPFTDIVSDFNRTLYHVKEHNGGDPERRFAAVLDVREPTIGEITYLGNETGLSTDGATNLIAPGSPTYNLGRYVDLTTSHLSDRDVLYARTRIRINGTWQDLSLDPSTRTGGVNDANSDGFPGTSLYDEDGDSLAAKSNAFDEDEDGTEGEAGEGIDFADREVHAAAQDSVSDAAATYSNGLHAQNDYTDNDNDAFFVYDSYENHGLTAAPGLGVGRIYWYNIDESTTNQFDDDNDGSTDEADEAAESAGYGNGAQDDNEDGIANGEAVAVPITAIVTLRGSPVYSTLAISYDPFGLGLYAAPAPGPGVAGDEVLVDAAHVFGRRPVDANDSKNTPFYANELAYGEVIPRAYEDLTDSERTFALSGYDLGGTTDSTSAEARAFNWKGTHDGDNIDWEVLANIYGLTADGATTYQIRLNGYDRAGNVKELWSEPITFTLDLTPPAAEITDCATGGAPEDFSDVLPATDGIQVYDAGKHPEDYTLTATADAEAVAVTFYQSTTPDFDDASPLGTDNTAPYTWEWPGDGMYTVNNYPAANADTVYFFATAEDEFGNTTPDADVCATQIIVIDGTNPTTIITQIGDDDDLEDGACVAPDSSITIFANVFDNDLDLEGNPLNWCAGLDFATGDRNVDDDNDGDTDEDDVDGDGIYTEGIDIAGNDGVPGTDDDEWNGSDNGANNLHNTDDYQTYDIVKVVFEYNPVADSPDAGWLPIDTVHGDPYSNPPQVIDWTQPVAATWNTLDLETGNYDVRAWACDIEGNCDSLTAFITSVCIRSEPLRAYILPEVCTDDTEYDLYAIHHIHDYEIDRVRFEYYYDANGDGCANDAGSWTQIDTDDEQSGRGDAVLYWPSEEQTSADNIESISFREALQFSDYRYYDQDHDGYSPKDPVVDESEGGVLGIYDLDGEDRPVLGGGGDEVVIGDASEIPVGAPLTQFADDEFYADAEGNGLEETDWIFRENDLNGTNGNLDLWNVTWDVTGLPVGSYLVRAIATDETNQEDVITYTCYSPAEQNPEEIEQVVIDTEVPSANLTEISLPDGSSFDISGSNQPYIPGNTKCFKICADADDAARVLFEYSLDGGSTWHELDVNNDEDFFADVDGTYGFTSGDELFNDLNGNWEYDGPAVDFVRYDGGDGSVDTPLGWPLCALSGEDGDSDGQTLAEPMEPNATCPGFLLHDNDQIEGAELTAGDLDLYSFYANAGDEITVETSQFDNADDTYLEVLSENCSVVLYADDNSGAGLFSEIEFVAEYSGLFNVRVRTEDGSPADYNLDLNIISNGDTDDDNDGVSDEDPLVGDPANGDIGSPEDYSSPYCVYVDVTKLPLWTDVNVLFRATAADQVCDIYRDDESPDVVSVIIGENQAPEADIVRAEDQDGVEIDVRPSIMDDDACDTIGSDTQTMNVFVTAEDLSAVDLVDLYWRLDPNCYADLTFEQLQWQSMSVAGLTAEDAVYPYDFAVAMANVADGAYQFYPRAVDKNGNATPPPASPWCFKKFANAGVDFAFVSTPTPPPAAPDHAAPGDEYVIHASLIDPADAPTTAVRFYYAERVLGESLDPTLVQPLSPFTSTELDETIVSTELGDGVAVTINGTAGTFHTDLSTVASPTKFDFTVDSGNNAIVFGARPDAADAILVSYNVTGWSQINEGDDWSPYTVAWSQENGGVPEPENNSADAYDLIATARFDVNGDGEYNGSDECDYDEALLSEGNYLILDDQERPLVKILGLDWSDDNPEQQDDCPDYNWPGNPLFNSGDNVGDYDFVAKLSGVETDVFVLAADQGGSSIDSVSLQITAEALTGNRTAVVKTYAMTEYTTAQTTIDIPITFYEDDYTQWTPGSIENVILELTDGETFTRVYEMTDMGSYWQATARFDVGAQTLYQFRVDLVGDLQESVADARNSCEQLLLGTPVVSLLIVPETPFWYTHLDATTELTNNAVHQAVATAWDSAGNWGNNLNSGMPGDPDDHQGQVVFIHDRTNPEVDGILAFDDDNRPLVCDRVSPQESYNLVAQINDDPFTDLNILAVRNALFQYSPNGGQAWIDISDSGPTNDGGFLVSWEPVNGETDGYDNDADGLWDEEDERIYTAQIRVVAFDDGNNSSYSDRQTPPVVWSITVDAAEPTAALSSPLNGQVFGFDQAITMAGTANGDWLPTSGTNDIDHARFQVRIGSDTGQIYYVDNSGGHAGYYDNGIDELWADVDADDEFSDSDAPLYPGVDGGFEEPNGSSAQFWLDLDPTPQDNGDFPRLDEPNNGAEYRLSWTPNDYAFARGYIDDNPIWQVDEYVRGRMLTTDCAGNEDTDNDGYNPPFVVFLLNDDTTPRAYITVVDDEVIDAVEVLPIQARDAVEIEGTVGPNFYQLVRVQVYMEANGVETLIGIDSDSDVYLDGAFDLSWDAEGLAEGVYTLFATTVDEDGNESDHASAARVSVRIDRTGPAVVYNVDGSLFDGFVVTETYTDDGVADQSSLVIHPDPSTGDVLFQVATTATDVESIVLQWRYASDPAGLWRDGGSLLDDGSSFDYEPNLNYAAGGQTFLVWRLHVEDFADNVFEEGVMEFRGLATDEAGNTNALQTDWAAATVDASDPTLFDWNDDSPTNQVEVGSTTHFEISLQDLDYTDVMDAQLWYRNVTDDGEWTLFGADTDLVGHDIDTDHGSWIAEFDWVAPTFVVHDTQYEFQVKAWDSAWNDATFSHPNEVVITVEDNASPDRTKIVMIAGEVDVTDDGCEKRPDGTNETLIEENDDVFIDVNTDDVYTAGVDILISEGENSGVFCPTEETIGAACNVWPRSVTESYLSDANARNEARVARTVTIVGRTQADDDGIDAGIAFVTFIAQRLDDQGNVVETLELGKDEYAPFFPLYYWHLTWDTEAVDISGNRLYPDGRYRLGAWAVDQEGNVEDVNSLDLTAAIIVVDNEQPATQMDANAATNDVEKTVTAQRNSMFTLFARTLAPGSNAVVNDEDDTVTFWYKRSRDLNMEDSWKMVPEGAGFDDEDGNPDETRPYSFDVNLGELTDPTDEVNNPPLAVGESYDFVASASDPNCNEISNVETFADDAVSGVGTRYLSINIIDTIAPCLEITELARKHGDTDPIINPSRVHAQDLEYITAKLLSGDRDLDHVEFVYRQQGTSTWNLIDATLTGDESGVTWNLGEWDLRTLTQNTWYEVAAVGVDNVGNVCATPDIVEIYVDYESPLTTWVRPTPGVWCDPSELSAGREIDLVVQVDRGTNNQHDDVWNVIWEVKASDQDSTEWASVSSESFTYDDANNSYGSTFDLEDLADEFSTACSSASTLWDMRVRVLDQAGNESVLWSWKNVVDLTAPNSVQISNISWEGDDVTQDPFDGSQYTDVTAGTRVAIYGTAKDDEPCIPAELETGISVMKFQAAFDIGQDGDANDGEIWRDLGTLAYDSPDFGDPSAVSDSVLWNTTGLSEGQYFVRVGAKDECQNPVGDYAWSAAANVRITDQTPPIAWVSCWDSDLQPHGVNPPTLTTLYALSESDPDIEDVQFQYNVRSEGESTPAGEWINIGLPDFQDGEGTPTTDVLWSTTIELNNFEDGQQLWLRALARDEAGNRFGDNAEDVVPVLAAKVVRLADGTMTLEAERSSAQQGGSEVVEDVSLQIEAITPQNDEEPQIIVTVKMARVDVIPQIVILNETALLFDYPSFDDPEIISEENGDLRRSLNDPTVWRFEMEDIDRQDDCKNWKICITGFDGVTGTTQWVDMNGTAFYEYPVDEEVGTNGTVALDAYSLTPGVEVTVGTGAVNEEDCLLVSPTYAPLASHQQSSTMNPVAGTAYHLELLNVFGIDNGDFNRGYEPEVVIHYSDAAVAAAIEGTPATEASLEVRRWNPNHQNGDGTEGAWVATGITHMHVNPEANEVSFRVDNLHWTYDIDGDTDSDTDGNTEPKNRGGGEGAGSTGNVFQIVAETGNGPVTFASFWPTSPYVSDIWTDPTPETVAYLKDQGGQPIDPQSVEVLIDGEFWATWYLTSDEEEDLDCTDGADADTLDDDCGYEADYRRGSTVAYLQWVNAQHSVMELRYDHSTDRRDWLTDGEHTMTVRYMPADGSDQWIEATTNFNVDRTSPYIAFDGGWVDNPRLIGLAGYMNPADERLQVKMYDGGSGILFKHNRGGDGYDDDFGVKYDLWLVDGEDDQNDIDEIEERVLLHQGTADELAPWIEPKLEDYIPASDTLTVPVPVVGGGAIKNGDVLEIVWYSDKYIEANNDGPGFGCDVDTMVVNGHDILVYGMECTYDSYSQEMHIYNTGVMDWAGNSGSRYVEQRFIVDMAPPVCTVVSPAATVEPDGDLHIEVTLDDGDGAGIDPSSITVVVRDPNGDEVEIEDLTITEDGITGHISGPLVRGEYEVKVTSTDKLGNKCVTTRTVRVESAILTMTEAMAYPNPFDPAEANAKIHFSLSKTSDVTVKVYDWNGNFVTTLAANQSMGGGAHSIEWGGEASDGTDLANGTYIARVTATDGKRTEEANLKVVLWRE